MRVSDQELLHYLSRMPLLDAAGVAITTNASATALLTRSEGSNSSSFTESNTAFLAGVVVGGDAAPETQEGQNR